MSDAQTTRTDLDPRCGAPGTTPDAFADELNSYLAEASMERLSDRLVTRLKSGDKHGPDVVWTTHDSAIGPLLLAFRGSAVVRVAFESEGFDAVVETLGERLGRRTLRASRPADELRRQLDAYLGGERTTFDVPFDLVLSSAPFRREVQQSLPTIPYGRTASYADVAAAAGRPKAVRAVGSACATNPLPIVLPCHRVLRSDGSLGQYLGGTQTKQFLLEHERTHTSSAHG